MTLPLDPDREQTPRADADAPAGRGPEGGTSEAGSGADLTLQTAEGPREVGKPVAGDEVDEGVSLLRVIPGCVLAWAVPGLGHVVLGRVGRGLIFGALVLALLIGGLLLDGKVYRPIEGEPLTYLAALGAAGAGVPFLIAHTAGWADGNVTSAYHGYGNTFTLVAGLLNLLVVLDAYDVALGRR